MNPLNPDIEAAFFYCSTKLSVKVDVKDDFMVVGRVEDLTFELTDFKALFHTPETLDGIKDKIQGLQPILV